MRRTYTRERYLALVERLRAAIPDLALGTDIIVGFPGETDDDFEQTLEVVEEVGFDSAFTFVYSPRQGTEAAAMPDQVPHELKIERMERLVEADPAARRRAQRRARRPGRAGARRGRRRAPTRRCCAAARAATRPSTSPASAAAGELVDVRIEHATSTTLRGTQDGARARRAASGRLRPMRILVTGSSGQIGTNLALRLHRRRPLGLRRRQAPEHRGRDDGSRRCPRTSPATTRPSAAGSTRSSTPRSTSSSISPRTRRCTSSCASRSGRSRT